MTTLTKPKELYDLAYRTYGLNMQMMVCIEEFAELTKEFSKFQRGYHNFEKIKEEIVDASIMIEQMRQIFFADDRDKDFEEIKKAKLQRLALRLEVEYEQTGQISPDGYSPQQTL